MLFYMAWRNVIRSRRRSLLTLLLSALSTLLFIILLSMLEGIFAKVYQDSIEAYPGYIRIIGKGFAENPDYDHLLQNSTGLKAAVRQRQDVAYAAERFEGFGLFAGQENSVGGMIVGIEPDIEAKMTRIPRAVLQGRYLLRNDTNGIIMGKLLAEKMGVEVGESISFISSATDYSFAADNFTVQGIYETGLYQFDANVAFINKSYFDTLILSKNLATHIIIEPTIKDDSQRVAKALQETFGDRYDIEEWHTTLRSLIDELELLRISRLSFIWFIVVIIFFVIGIYTLMIIFSRKKEIGVMRALGTGANQITMILLLETVIVALLGIGLGSLIGCSVAYYVELHPIVFDTMTEEVRQIGIAEPVFPAKLLFSNVAKSATYIFILNLLVSLYPVYMINRDDPMTNIREL